MLLILQMQHPIDVVNNRFGNLELDSGKVVMGKCPRDDNVKKLEDALKKCNPDCDPKMTSFSSLKKMPKLKELLESEEHIQMLECTFEMRLHGKGKPTVKFVMTPARRLERQKQRMGNCVKKFLETCHCPLKFR